MHTLETTFRSSLFWLAVVLPPTGYWMVVQMCALQAGDGVMPLGRLAMLIALGQVIPLGALLWVLCSVAAYTIAPGKLIEHRVVRDREFVFGPRTTITELADGEIALMLPGRTLRLRVAEPARCLALLREAVAASPVACR